MIDLHNTQPTMGAFQISKIGVEVSGEPTFEEWLSCGQQLATFEKGIHFCIGDWLNYGEAKWGEMYEEAIEKTGFNSQTLMNDKWIASRVHFSRRREKLSFGHHAEVAASAPEEQSFLLEQAETLGLSVRQLREKKESLLHPTKVVETVPALPSIQQPLPSPEPIIRPVPSFSVQPALTEHESALAGYRGYERWQEAHEWKRKERELEPETSARVQSPSILPEAQDEQAFVQWQQDNLTLGLDKWGDPLPTQPSQEEESAKEKRDAHVMRVMGSSDSPEWYTPQIIIDRVLQMFGEVDTDPCSNSHEAPSVPARTLYTKEDDGLAQVWTGKTYLNPPYGTEISAWTDKLVAEYKRGNVEEALALLPGRIDTVWFSPLYEYVMCNVRGRLQFANSPYNAPFPCVIVYLGTRISDFIEVFGTLGPVMRRIG